MKLQEKERSVYIQSQARNQANLEYKSDRTETLTSLERQARRLGCNVSLANVLRSKTIRIIQTDVASCYKLGAVGEKTKKRSHV